jgi:hypothetical protein
VTDHGWLLVPGGMPKTELAKFLTATRWGRCAALSDTAKPTALTLTWSWCANDPKTSKAGGGKPLKAGKASLVVENEELEGEAISLVILDDDGRAAVNPAAPPPTPATSTSADRCRQSRRVGR